jgi:hypothetical protein
VYRSLGALASLLWIANASAAVPAEYTGTPYLGTPRPIPGRIDFADVDLGGFDVAWNTDHNRMTDAPQSGDDYRPDDMALPNINKTNRFLIDQTWSEDFWEEAAGGGRYPSEAEPHAYYLGATHVDDWVRLTVDVQQAGTYNISSNWACDNNPCGFSLWFNDDSGVVDDPNRPLHGTNKTGTVELDTTGDYHLWREYPNFVQVELSAGLQVMTFHVEVADHLQYSFLQFDLVGGGGAGGAGGAAGAAGSGGDTSAGAGAGEPGDAGAAGTSGTPAAAGTAGGGATGTAGNPATAGMADTGTAGMIAGTGGSATTPMATSPNGNSVDSESGCSLRKSNSQASWLSLAVLLAAVGLRRRRESSGTYVSVL